MNEIYPDFIQSIISDNTLNDWLLALTIGLSIYLVTTAFLLLISKRLSKTQTDDENHRLATILSVFSNTKKILILLIALGFALKSLTTPESIEKIITTITLTAVFFQLAFWLTNVIDKLIDRKMEPKMVNTMKRISSTFIWVITIIICIDNIPGVEITALLASVGVAGLAVSLALQRIFQDIFSALAITVDKPFEIGDFIAFDGSMGSVESIGWKSTRIKSLTGEMIVRGNTDLLNTKVSNYRFLEQRLEIIPLRFRMNMPIESIKAFPEWIRTEINNTEKTEFLRGTLKSIENNVLTYEFVFYIKTSDYNEYMAIKEIINLKILDICIQKGFSFAENTLYVYK